MQPRQAVVLEMRAQHGREQPGADDVCPADANPSETRPEKFGILTPSACDCGVIEEVAHVSITLGRPRIRRLAR